MKNNSKNESMVMADGLGAGQQWWFYGRPGNS
jgi:hypothetical protein